MILCMYIALGQGRKPPGDELLMSTESPYHCDFVASFKQISLNSNLYTFFNVFPRVYSPGTGVDDL